MFASELFVTSFQIVSIAFVFLGYLWLVFVCLPCKFGIYICSLCTLLGCIYNWLSMFETITILFEVGWIRTWSFYFLFFIFYHFGNLFEAELFIPLLRNIGDLYLEVFVNELVPVCAYCTVSYCTVGPSSSEEEKSWLLTKTMTNPITRFLWFLALIKWHRPGLANRWLTQIIFGTYYSI